MSFNNKNLFFFFEIIYNSQGQIRLKKRFLKNLIKNFYRNILGGS